MKLIAGSIIVLAGAILIAGAVVAIAVCASDRVNAAPGTLAGLIGVCVGGFGLVIVISELRTATKGEPAAALAPQQTEANQPVS